MYMLMYILYCNMRIGLQNMNKFDLSIIVPIFQYTLIGQPKQFHHIFYDK